MSGAGQCFRLKHCDGSLTQYLGTGGTIAGIGQYVKSMNEDVVVALTDPEGSGLYNKVIGYSEHNALILMVPRRSSTMSCLTREKVKEQKDAIK